MQSGRLWLSGLMISGCVGLLAGCSATPTKETETTASAKAETETTESDNRTAAVKTEYIIKHAPKSSPVAKALPLPTPQSRVQLAEQRRQEQLREQRQREWELKQAQARQRAEYRQRYEQKQAAAEREQAAEQAQAQKVAYQQRQQTQEQAAAEARRAQYQREWQEKQAKREQYQRQWQQQQQQQQARRQPVQSQPTKGYGGQGVGNYSANQLSGDFAGNRQLLSFIRAMGAKHGFDENYLYGVFSQTRNRDEVARLWAGNGGGSSSGSGWYNYRSKFVTPANVQKGTQFWREYQPYLLRASQQYGVDPAYIVGIMGVETRWGRILGKHRVIDALTTSAIVNQRRSSFFFQELENYLLMTRSERMDPLKPMGSYAGAMGYGQFMPSSFRAFAVDYDGDGIRDLWNPVDAIGSIANYFAKHGWKRGQDVAVPAHVTSMDYVDMPDGFKVKYSTARLAQKGIRPREGNWQQTGRTHLLALTTVPGGLKEPWIGYHNFYVITRYNHSNYYAMAVHQLAQEVKQQVGGQQYASR
ncbi:MAG: lytic murein transglycosylase B [Thiolinea sp.]